MKKIIIFSMLFICACSKNNERKFNFIYLVELESTNGKKIEMWIPVPKTNEVQIIDNSQINSDGLNYTIEEEVVHNNKYLYINEPAGTQNKKRSFSG